MNQKAKHTIDQFGREELLARLEKAEETLRAIQTGAVDAIVVSGPEGPQVFTLKGADHTYRTLMQEISEGALSMTPSGRILYANPSFGQMLGRPLSEISGRSLRNFVVPEDWPVLEEVLRSAPAKREVWLEGAGRRVPVLFSAGRFETEGVQALCAVITDLTVQKRNEEILASGQLARAILDHAPEVVIVLDAEGRILRASGTATNMVRGPCTGRPFESVFTLQRDGSRGAFLQSRELLEAARKPERFDAILSTRRETRIVQVSAAQLIGASNDVMGCVLTMADISERRRMESALRENEQRRALATEAAGVGTWEWDVANQRMIADSKMYQLFGADESSTTVRENFDFVHPADRDRVRHAQWKAIQHGTGFEEEFRVTWPDGSEHWLAAIGKVHCDAAGQPARFLGATSDITERRQAEQRIEERNRQLDLMARTAQRLLFSADAEFELEGIFRDVAELVDMEMFYHYRPCEEPRLMKLVISGGVSEDRSARIATMRFGELLCGKVAESRERLIVEDLQHSTHPGGEVLRGEGATSYAGFPLVANGELIGTLAFVSQRRTRLTEGAVQMIEAVCGQVAIALERTRLQKRLGESLLRLKENEERLRLAVEAADLGSWDLNLLTGEAVWSRRHADMLGYQPEDAPATMQRWVERIHPEDLDSVMTALEKAKQQRSLFAIEHRALRADTGEQRWLSLSGRYLYDETGKPVRFSGVSLDITERKQHEQRQAFLMQLREDLSSLSDADEIHEAVTQITMDFFRADRCYYCEIAEDTAVIRRDASRENLPSVAGAYPLSNFPIFKSAVETGHPTVVCDASTTDVLDEPLRQLCLQLQIVSFIDVPVIKNGKPVGIFCLVQSTPRNWTDFDVEVVQETAERTWSAVERARAEQAVRQREAEFRTIANAVPALVWVCSTSGENIFFNERWIEYTGQSPEQAAGFGWTEVMHPDDAERILPYWQRCCETGEPYEGEVRYRRFDGAYRWFMFRALPTRDEHGNIVKWCGSSFDIHEAKESREALHDSEQRLSLAMAAANAGSWKVNPATGEFVGSNRAMALHGLSPGGPMNQDRAFGCVHPDDRDVVETALRLTIETGEPFRLELRIPEPDGAVRWIASQAERRNVNGEPTVVGLVQDVTTRKRAEEALRRNAETFAALVEKSPLGIYTVDSQFRIQHVSMGAMSAFRSVRPLIGRDFAEAMRIIWPEPFASEAIRIFRHTLETGEPYVSSGLTETRHDIGAIESYEWQTNRVTLADGHYGVVCYFFDSTRLQQAHHAVRESEERYRATFDNAAIGIAHFDLNGRWLRFNDAVCRITGYSREELSSRNFADVTHPDDIEPDWQQSRRLLAGEISTYTMDKRYIRKDGSLMWVRLTVSLLHDHTGAPLHFISVIEDIDVRKRAQQALREHSELLRTVLESITDLVWVKDTQGRITMGNKATFDLLGAGDQDKVMGLGTLELIPDPEQARQIIENDNRVMRSGHAEIVEEQFGAPDDKMIFQTVKGPLRDATGRVIGVVGVSRDVTEDRRIARQMQAYAGRQAFLVRLNDSLRSLTDAEAIKAAAARLLGEHLQAGRVGYAECQGEVCTIGRHYSDGLAGIAGQYRLSDYGPIFPDLLAGRPIVNPDIANDSSLSQQQKFAYAAMRVGATANIPLVKGGELAAVLFVHHRLPRSYTAGELDLIHEVAERTWAAVEQARTEMELRAVNRDLEQFAYSASHDLKEPLRNVAIYSQLLADRCKDQLDPQTDKFLHFITEGAQRMELLVSDLLSYMQSTQPDEQPVESVRAEQVLKSVLTNLSQAIGESDAVVTNDTLPVVPVKEVHLQQLLQNLIANSIKYRRDSEAPRIHVSASPENGRWQFAVRDNGIGIAPQFHDRVFGLFKRLHSRSSSYPGTGIGLAICKKVVERYGGTIWLESAPGKGTTFYFTLPHAGGG